jgi:hypothetical protein
MTAIPSWAARGRVPTFVALAIACAVISALLGWLAGRAVTPWAPGSSGESRTVRLGRVELIVPASWTPVEPARTRVPGLDPRGSLAFEIAPGVAGYAVVALAAGAGDPGLIPPSLLHALKKPFGAPVSVALAGHRAWAYRGVATRRRALAMDVAVLPTSAGVLSVACVGTRPMLIATAGCEQNVEHISLAGARVLEPTRAVAFSLIEGSALARLGRRRDRGDRALHAARTHEVQARALTEVGDAYAAAAARLAPLAPGDGDRTRLVASLREAARAYRRARAAAAAGAPAAYGAAGAAVLAAETRVARMVGR